MTTTVADDDGRLEGFADPAPFAAPAGAGGAWLARLRAVAHLIVPLLVLVILAAPSVNFLLPATQDYLDEIYQPLQALKFFQSRGTEFHKYGPMPNFVLAPGYAASLAYWKLTGSFSSPSGDFPYGFQRPFEQMGFMIFQGRVLFLAIGVIGFAALAHALRRATNSPAAVGFALLFTLATNHAVVYALPSPRPDSPMLGFAALALACYVTILFDGLTLRRGAWMSVWVACAASSKELAAPMFVLPYLGLIAMLWRESERERTSTGGGTTDGAVSAMVYTVATGAITYALLNIVYAPATWLRRMQFWIGGPGIDAEVWGHGGIRARIIGTLGCVLNDLGPAGFIVTGVGIVAYLVARPPRWVMLLLPAVSVFALGLAKIQYPADRFYTILCLAMFPVVAVGLGTLLEPAPDRRPGRGAVATLVLLAAVNAWWATFSWHALGGSFQFAVERHALRHVGRDQSVATLDTFARNPGSSRLDFLGFRHDPRSIQQLAAQRTNLPDWLYAMQGKAMFLEQAKVMPARALMIKRDSGFDVSAWNGFEGLGYAPAETLVPATPRWFPFDWMPAVKAWKLRRALLVYRRQPAEPVQATTSH